MSTMQPGLRAEGQLSGRADLMDEERRPLTELRGPTWAERPTHTTPHRYRGLAVPLPTEVEVTHATEAEPLLAISLEIDLATLTEAVLDLDDRGHRPIPRNLHAACTCRA